MSSTGQIIGGIGGAVVGFFVGGPMGAVQGAALGSSIGGWIDPPPGPDLRGPTLDDKSFQSAAYGVSIAKLYGTIATTGNIIYLENNEYTAIESTEKTGGKGGPEGTYTTTTYLATFAIALGERMPGSRPLRIWAGGKLIYSAGTNDLLSLVQSSEVALKFKYYSGTQTLPDSRMEAVLGVGNCPSYENTAYIIFYDFDLTPYGNGLAGCPMKVELSSAETEMQHAGVRSIAFDEPGYATASRYSLLPFSGKSSYAQASRVVEGDVVLGRKKYSFLNVQTLGEIEADEADESPQLTGIQGYSERATYALRETYLDGGTYERQFIRTESGEYECALRNDENSNYLGAYFEQIYDLGPGNVFFIMDPQLGMIDPPFGDKLLWRYEPSVFDNYLAESEIGGFGVLGFDTRKGWVVSVLGNDVRIYDAYDWAEIKTFSVAVGGGTAGLIDGDVFYLLQSTQDEINSGEINIAQINLEDETFELFSVSVAPYIGTGGAFAPSISKSGPIIAIGVQAPGAIVNIHYINAQGVAPGDLDVDLDVIVNDQLIVSGIDQQYINLDQLHELDVFGYRFSGPGSARGALGPLQIAHLFDLVEIGYMMTAVKRGASPDQTVPIAHLNARAYGDAPGLLIKKDIETDSQLPSRYSVSYLDYEREYDTSTQYADFPSRRVNERNESLAVVMSSGNAAWLADVLGNLAWVEKSRLTFSLPQIYLGWHVGDIKNIEVLPGVYAVVRINDLTVTADQRLEVTAKLAEPAVYTSGAVGSVGVPPVQTIPFAGESVGVFMDIPMIIESTNVPGYVLGMAGAGSWPGAVWLRSMDLGQTYNSVGRVNNQSTIATCNDSLASNDGYIIDRDGTLNISQLAGEFEAITESQMMTGQNYCAYGVDGRWEIIRYADSVLETNGTKTLSTFIRGMRGTEWATGLHQAGDYLVLLDDPDNVFITTDLASVGMQSLFKAVTIGQSVDEAEPLEHIYQAVNLKPLSPVLPVGEIITNDWHISWTSRTRFVSTFWHTGVQPVNESPLRFKVEIISGDVVRAIESGTASAIYTEEQQIEDFGSVQTSLDIKIYQYSERVGHGYPLEVTL